MTAMATGTEEMRVALPGDVARALSWLRANLDEPVRLERLAEIAGVRPRTLEKHFREFLRTTPLAWARQARLQRTRQQLLAGASNDTVTTIALGSGFTQLGRFAARYREKFGELPGQTLKRARFAPGEHAVEIDDEAYRLTWRALQAAWAVAPRECNSALDDVARASERAPDYALPRAVAAFCWAQRGAQRFGSTPAADLARAQTLAAEATRLAPHDAMALTLSAGALTLAHRLVDADRQLERALALDPWSPWAWMRRGWASAYAGEGDAGIRELRTALHLMPFEPIRHIIFIGIGCAHFVEGRFEQAAAWTRDGLDANPGSFWAARVLIAAAAQAGARDEARRRRRWLMRRDPGLTIAGVEKAWPFPPWFNARLCDGLETAGVPRA